MDFCPVSVVEAVGILVPVFLKKKEINND